MDKSRGVSGISWGSSGTGIYAGQQFRDFFRQLQRNFERRGGFFTRAFSTIMHRNMFITIVKTNFRNDLLGRSDYTKSLNFKKAIFTRELDVETVLFILCAVKAYALAAGGVELAPVFTRAEAGKITVRALRGIDLTPLADLQQSNTAEIAAFKQDPFFIRLSAWIKTGPETKYRPDDPWVASYYGEDCTFYRSVIAWMEKNNMLVYEEKTPPPPPQPEQPPQITPQPVQRDLFLK
jgi:hypothetical protein